MSLIQYRNNNSDVARNIFNEDFFLAPFFPSQLYNASSFAVALDVQEDAQQYTVVADLPGVKKEDVHVSFDNGILTVQGERKSEEVQKEKNYLRTERSYGQFVRSLNVGTDIDANGIKASYKDGVLTISVPKSEKAKPKSIDIQVG